VQPTHCCHSINQIDPQQTTLKNQNLPILNENEKYIEAK